MTMTVSITGKEFREAYSSFAKNLLQKKKEQAIDFIKRQIENSYRAIDYHVYKAEEFNRSLFVRIGLVSSVPKLDVDATKAQALNDILDRFTKSGNINDPRDELIVSQDHNRAAADLYWKFKNCDFSDDAVITLSIDCYRELNRVNTWEQK